MMRRLVSITLTCIMLFGTIYTQVFSAYANETADVSVMASKSGDYTEYKARYDEKNLTSQKIEISKKAKVENQSINADFEVYESGFYTFGLKYKAYGDGTSNLIMGIKIDGKYPFLEAEKIEFPRMWCQSGEVRVDGLGNEFSPEMLQCENFILNYAIDISGWSSDRYNFYLEKGKHSVEILPVDGCFELESIVFGIPDNETKYSAVLGENYNGKQILLEGEEADFFSNYWLISRSDNTSASVYPASIDTNRVNYIGGSTWKSPGETITWKFEAPETGYYQIGFTYRQSALINCNTYRKLRIDGEIPFTQAKEIAFSYSTDWENKNFADDSGTPYLIFLKKGPHELSLEATPGPITQVSLLLSDTVSILGSLYMDITMITGETVDNYRSYDLFNSVSNIESRLTVAYENLEKASKLLSEIGKKGSGSYSSSINSMSQVIGQMLENKYTAHRYVSDYYSKYCSLASTLNEMRDMPLDIDRIILASPNKKIEYNEVGFFTKIGFSITKFFSSFIKDYNNISGVSEDENHLTIWVNWGRDQAQVLNSLIQSSFTAEYGVAVDVKVTNATIVQSVLSGSEPDVILQQARSEPINLAIRNVLLDLTEFKDCNDVLKRFQPGADIPYRYKDGLYALPDTQTFYLMFYRTDIFEDMGIEVPKTWDEFITVSKLLSRNNLQTWLHYTQITALTQVNTGIGSLNIFPSLLLQNGLNLYTEDGHSTTLSNSDTVKVFEFWTDFYTKLKLPKTVSFYNRFRIGTCPLGIEQYTTYTTLKAAAPEIDGLWSVAPIPGIKTSDGKISNISSGGGTGCSITKATDNKKAAWNFLKWWTSEETQLAYSNNLESVLGPTGRVAISNVSAFERMSWDDSMKSDILEAWSEVKEIAELPGSYYVSRSVDLSFWNVVNQNLNPKDILLKRSVEVDDEIKRKWKQYEHR